MKKEVYLGEADLDEIKVSAGCVFASAVFILTISCVLLPAVFVPWSLVLLVGFLMSRPVLKFERIFDPGRDGGKRFDPVGDAILVEPFDDDVYDRLDALAAFLLVGFHFVVNLPAYSIALGLLHRLEALKWTGRIAASAVVACWPFLILALAFSYAHHGHTGIAKLLGAVVCLDAIGEIHRLFTRVRMPKHRGRVILGLVSKRIRLRSTLRAGLIVIVSFAAIYYALGRDHSTSFNKPLGILDSIYFSVVTAATVGYGDLSPATDTAKLLCMLEIALGFIFIVLVFSTVLSVWQKEHIADAPDITAKEPPEAKWDPDIVPWI